MPEFSPDATAYLVGLRRAVADLPDGADIVDGVREELAGLDDQHARQRILTLGDPRHIAAEARGFTEPRVFAEPQDEPARTSTAWHLAPSLLMALGGFIVPVIGAVVGLVLVWMSGVWPRWQKLVATIVPLGAAVLAILAAALTVPSAAGATNPLMPAAYDLIWSAPIAWLALTAAAGIWLLIVGGRRRR